MKEPLHKANRAIGDFVAAVSQEENTRNLPLGKLRVFFFLNPESVKLIKK